MDERALDDLWDYGDLAASEARFRQRLDDLGAAGGETAQSAEVRTQLARSQGLQHQFDAAHATLDQVEADLPSLPARVHVRYLLERGRVFNSSGQQERAIPLFRDAWERGRAAGEDGLAVDAAHMLGIAETGDESMAWNLRALDLASTSAQPAAQRWQASLFNNIGWSYFDAERYNDALTMFERALTRREAEHAARKEVLIARWCIARVYRAWGRVEEALAMQRALLAEHERDQGEDGFVSEELGECLLALGHADEATPHFQRAYTLLSQDSWLTEAEPERIARLKRLGEGSSEIEKA